MSDFNKLSYSELVQINDELRQIISDLKKEKEEYNKCTSTVYDPNRMMDQKTLIESKVKYAVLQKDKEIDALKAQNDRINNMLSDAEKRLSDKLCNNMELKQRNNEVEEKISILEQEKTTAINRLTDSMSQMNKEIQTIKQDNYNLKSRNNDLEKVINNQDTIITLAAGYISGCEQFRTQHPIQVKKWLLGGMK